MLRGNSELQWAALQISDSRCGGREEQQQHFAVSWGKWYKPANDLCEQEVFRFQTIHGKNKELKDHHHCSLSPGCQFITVAKPHVLLHISIYGKLFIKFSSKWEFSHPENSFCLHKVLKLKIFHLGIIIHKYMRSLIAGKTLVPTEGKTRWSASLSSSV